jgi:hypothetical protein
VKAALAGILLLTASSSAFAINCSDPNSLQTLAEIRQCQWLVNQAEMIANERAVLEASMVGMAKRGQSLPSPAPKAMVSLKGPQSAKEIPITSNVTELLR